MKVGLIAPPWVAVPPPLYGGTEVVLDVLARGLVAAGHQVELFTTGDSTCAVPRQWVHATALGTTGATIMDEASHVVAAYRAFADCDVIHDHTLLGPLYGPGLVAAPVVTTSHGPFVDVQASLFEVIAERASVIAISHHQRSTAPSLRVDAVIHHGVDFDRFPVGSGEGGFAMFLGRMSPDKGADRAIVAARAAGVPLVLAAKMWEPEERRYFAEVVEPMLGPDAVYVGQVGGDEKLDLLGRATCLINPIRWDEPFGMVMIEALACGTPVVAFSEGAAPEIVDDGITGFLVRDQAAMGAAVADIHRIDRRACRAATTERFSSARMVADHLRLYRRMIAAGSAGSLQEELAPTG